MTLKREEDLHQSTINRVFRVKGDNAFELVATDREVTEDLCKPNLVLIFEMCTGVYVWVGKDARTFVQDFSDIVLCACHLRCKGSLAQ